ncbi:MAG: hypothetical protein LBG59_02445 [Candidatus Peribacteria bacterium]|jgi:dihydroorotate dehydrogenase|nr:hypothetical protein [Candidatus Peribacteria bacterium]
MENQRVLTPLLELDKHPGKSHEVEHSWIVSIFTAIQKNFLVMLRRFTEQNTKINEVLNLSSSNTEVLKKLTRIQDEQKKLLSELKESVEKAKEPRKEKIFISHKQLLS